MTNKLFSAGWLLLGVVLCSCDGPGPNEAGIVVPNEYEGGSFIIRECRKEGILPYTMALEKHGDWYWEFPEIKDVVYVKDIRPMMNAAEIWVGWADVSSISFSWEKVKSRQEIRISIDKSSR